MPFTKIEVLYLYSPIVTLNPAALKVRTAIQDPRPRQRVGILSFGAWIADSWIHQDLTELRSAIKNASLMI